MYLKSIEIYGFKSFANKVKINLNKGITAIVGPNGCGKSNIVDAIKWCVGEMSWKSLRMPSMMDVIFAGTTKRQPLNLAEVTLTFDNEERKLNFNFNEVAVTRKIYRSEESEYFINRAECRLRDIKDMFLDTGIGSGGYAIIDQGEVEKILSTTPEERREIFEEVAGVSKYKAKREEALKKMEKVEYDLSLLSGHMEIINEQIKKLDSEAKKARLQQKYKEELKEAEISLMVKDINNYKAEIDKENSILTPIVDELNEINSNISALEAEISNLNISLTEKTDEEKRIFEEIAIIKDKISKIEKDLEKDKAFIEEYSKQIEEIAINKIRREELCAKLNPLIEEEQKKLNELKSSFDSMKLEYDNSLNKIKEIENYIKEIDTEIHNKDKEIISIYQTELDITGNIARFESDITNIQSDINISNKDRENILSEKNVLIQKNEEISTKLNKLKSDFDNYKKSLDNLLNEKENSIFKIKEYEENINNLNIKKSSDKSKLETLILQAEKDSYWTGSNAVISAGISGVRGSLRHLVKFKKEDKLLFEDSLGKFLDAVVVDNESVALKCIEHLKYTKQGRCRFIILDKIPALTTINNSDPFSVLSKLDCDKDYSYLINYLLNNITFKGMDVFANFWIVGGVEEVATNESYWSDIDILKSEINKTEEEIIKLVSLRENMISYVSSLDNDIKKIQNEISNIQIELSSCENGLKRIQEELEIKNRNLELIENELNNKSSELNEKNEQISILKNELENIKRKSQEIKDETINLKNKRAEFEKQILVFKEEIGFKTSNISNFQKDIENLENNIKANKQRLDEANLEISAIDTKNGELSNKIEELKKNIEKYNSNEIEERNNLKELEIKKVQISDEIEHIKNEIDRLKHLLNDNRELLEENKTKKQDIDLKINTHTTRINDIMARLINDWQVNYDEVKDKYKDSEVNIERVNFLRKRIENMGAVNMTAPEEYDALVLQYNKINSQVEDLNKAKSDLRTAINRINDTTRENFKKTFDGVQNYFKQIYSTLFNGGEANLILTNPDNILETGVEIMAHPPGKKLVSISQLSGGEKSLTALALLFAFFCVNPSPFCVMDEVDSALDEANVERFVKLIKEFSGSTQFIIITHNKRTMEIADVMYGVTMEELGVSKIISVDLKKAIDISQSNVVGSKV